MYQTPTIFFNAIASVELHMSVIELLFADGLIRSARSKELEGLLGHFGQF